MKKSRLAWAAIAAAAVIFSGCSSTGTRDGAGDGAAQVVEGGSGAQIADLGADDGFATAWFVMLKFDDFVEFSIQCEGGAFS
jgi:predicted small secreted protein